MTVTNRPDSSDGIIGSIQNKDNPEQSVDIKYIKEENAFATIGIHRHFGVKDILIPAHLVATDFQLVGAIVSSILERISLAKESGSSFQYAPKFEVLDKVYSLAEYGDYMKLDVLDATGS